jgi:hypothetical protein
MPLRFALRALLTVLVVSASSGLAAAAERAPRARAVLATYPAVADTSEEATDDSPDASAEESGDAAPEPPATVTAEDAQPAAADAVPAAPTPPPATASTTPPAAQEPPVPPAPAKPPVLVPGTGALVKGSCDDFEDEKWKWYHNHPKSSEEMDKRMRGPLGRSVNGLWFEGPKRGTPDVVKRVALPAPGLEGSAHGLLISSLNAGIPGRITNQMQQDDLVYNMARAAGRGLAAADSPSVVVRVYVPPLEQWEKRSGPSFGFRAGCFTYAIITGDDHPDEGEFGMEEYWPGMFICLERADGKKIKADSAYIRVRGGRRGGEIRGPTLTEHGWWTLGLSFSPDGMVHYFASPGVDELTMDDHITSQFPYGYRTKWLKTYFFNVCTRDDGKTWSTPWVIDDPKVFFVKRAQMATKPRQAR